MFDGQPSFGQQDAPAQEAPVAQEQQSFVLSFRATFTNVELTIFGMQVQPTIRAATPAAASFGRARSADLIRTSAEQQPLPTTVRFRESIRSVPSTSRSATTAAATAAAAALGRIGLRSLQGRCRFALLPRSISRAWWNSEPLRSVQCCAGSTRLLGVRSATARTPSKCWSIISSPSFTFLLHPAE